MFRGHLRFVRQLSVIFACDFTHGTVTSYIYELAILLYSLSFFEFVQILWFVCCFITWCHYVYSNREVNWNPQSVEVSHEEGIHTQEMMDFCNVVTVMSRIQPYALHTIQYVFEYLRYFEEVCC